MKLVTITLLTVALTEPRVTARVSPGAVMAGNSVRVTCRVPAHPDNRGVYIGISDYTSHFVQIDGERGPITSEQWFPHITCEYSKAFCELVDNHGAHRFDYVPFTVGGCSQQIKR